MNAPAVAVGGRNAHDARQRARHLHDGEMAVPPERVGALQADDEIEALVLDLRERSGGIERERRKHRLDLGFEILLQCRDLCPRDFLRA